MCAGNYMIDGDSGRDPSSPKYDISKYEIIECDECQGTGEILDFDEELQIPIKEICHFCEGDGKINLGLRNEFTNYQD